MDTVGDLQRLGIGPRGGGFGAGFGNLGGPCCFQHARLHSLGGFGRKLGRLGALTSPVRVALSRQRRATRLLRGGLGPFGELLEILLEQFTLFMGNCRRPSSTPLSSASTARASARVTASTASAFRVAALLVTSMIDCVVRCSIWFRASFRLSVMTVVAAVVSRFVSVSTRCVTSLSK